MERTKPTLPVPFFNQPYYYIKFLILPTLANLHRNKCLIYLS
nr:MAG TPA: hypothetical protein [Caudoviricetes sp.]